MNKTVRIDNLNTTMVWSKAAYKDRFLVILNPAPLFGEFLLCHKKIRVDAVIGVGYDEDIKKTKEVQLTVLTGNPKVLQDPAPSVNVLELGESSVNFAVRPYCVPQDYWDVYFATIEGAKLALDKAGIEIPYPHSVEIHKGED